MQTWLKVLFTQWNTDNSWEKYLPANLWYCVLILFVVIFYK